MPLAMWGPFYPSITSLFPARVWVRGPERARAPVVLGRVFPRELERRESPHFPEQWRRRWRARLPSHHWVSSTIVTDTRLRFDALSGGDGGGAGVRPHCLSGAGRIEAVLVISASADHTAWCWRKDLCLRQVQHNFLPLLLLFRLFSNCAGPPVLTPAHRRRL